MNIQAFVCYVVVISDSCSSSKQVVPTSPQNRVPSHLSNISEPHSHKLSEPHSFSTKATCTQLKHSPQAITYQTPLQTPSAKENSRTPRKRERRSKKHKNKSSDLGSPDVSVEEIRDRLRPLPPCISPLLDTVRI